ncbi:aspartate dehydrogenase [Collimonas sp.]|jgi:aspartate dehydrogenase|uniref:aspartate dehydrogenase n=1 Tax=Collimonas sp. TaxID=1963772 RepID=UPI002CCD0050|nr:aspartate dehydrogenase [Collimonas sp.]HWW07311.1 aspartate dehydrogenase [Collimonas sp.]
MKTIAIAGFGAIGNAVAEGIDQGLDGIRLVAVSVRDQTTARSRLESLAQPPQYVPLQRIGECADIVVECAGAEVLRQIAAPVLQSGKQLVVLSASALVSSPELLALWEQYRRHIHIPSGAIGGLDAVAAMAEGEIRSAKLVTRKPPGALRSVSWLKEQGIVPESVRRPTMVFSGTAFDAVRYFPTNLNVAAALSLAGIGPLRTIVELWIDPDARRNHHAIEVYADSGSMHLSIEAVASMNPGTSSLAAQSVLSLLRRLGNAMVLDRD